MNKRLLRSIMVLNGDTNDDLAKYLGISKVSLSNKINENGAEFRQREIAAIKDRYKLTPLELEQIFFADEVS